MQALEWSNKLSIDKGLVDQDHKKLLEIVNNIREALQSSDNKKTSLVLLGELKDYTHYHFAREEKLQEVTNFPKLKHHIEEHNDMIVQLNDLIKEVKGLSEDVLSDAVVEKTSEFLRSWLLDHVVQHDLEMKPYISAMKQKAVDLEKLDILIVDDDSFFRKTIHNMLNWAHCNRILEAGDGKAGFETLKSATPPINLVLLDVHMPEVDGFGFIENVRNCDSETIRKTPIIVMSGDASGDLIQRAKKLGVEGYLVKPVSLNTLISHIKVALI